jgi:hypothetical protein
MIEGIEVEPKVGSYICIDKGTMSKILAWGELLRAGDNWQCPGYPGSRAWGREALFFLKKSYRKLLTCPVDSLRYVYLTLTHGEKTCRLKPNSKHCWPCTKTETQKSRP